MQKTLRLFALVTASVTSGAVYAAGAPPVLKAPPYVAPAYNWTGSYVGAHGGGAWADNKFFDVIGGADAAKFTANGYFGGGQIGYNWQMGSWVLGAELEGSLSRLQRGVCGQFGGFNQGFGGGFGGGGFGGGGFGQQGQCGGFNQGFGGGGFGGGFGQQGFGQQGQCGGFGGQLGARVHAIGLISGRLGYAWDRTLAYVKAGAALSYDKYVVNVPGVLSVTPTDTRLGWLIGAGVEYGLTANWSVKIEYNYIDLGTERLNLTGLDGVTFVFDQSQQVHLAKGGINYRF